MVERLIAIEVSTWSMEVTTQLVSKPNRAVELPPAITGSDAPGTSQGTERLCHGLRTGHTQIYI
jgi:hypothetical protein